jgi:hypothetical protein
VKFEEINRNEDVDERIAFGSAGNNRRCPGHVLIFQYITYLISS